MDSTNTLVTNELNKEASLRDKEASLRALALSLPIEEMLGSVTTYNTPDGFDSSNSGRFCQQLRTSARVIKKLKLDSGAASEKDKKDTAAINKDEEKPEIKQKVNRPKVVWSPEDKTQFFDALKEYGKDFDAIHDYIVSKYKKKGVAESSIKTKEQVRHFYYRTWHKISKYLKFSDEVKKVVQEYYALINYGELRRKIGVTTEKTCVKLNELMYRGSTQIRIRGKTIRIKTPMCRTLRRINQIDERPEDLKLPTKILVELRPRDLDTWMYVQAMAQNPRVHCTIPLQKRLNVLISYLNSKWKTYEQRACDKAFNNFTSNNESTLTNGDEKKFPVEPILRIAPKVGTSVQIPKINYSEFVTNCQISLNAYEERMGIKNRGETIWLASINTPKALNKSQLAKKGTKRVRNDSVGEKSVLIKKENSSSETDCDVGANATNLHVSEIVDSVVNTILALSHDTNCSDEKKSSDSEKDTKDNSTTIKTEDGDDHKIIEREIAIENIRNGWTIHNSESVSIGELYLMIGSDSKIELEYWWEIPEIKSENVTATIDVSQDFINKIEETSKCNQLTVVLQKLLSLAKLYYRKERIECPCGHVCGSTNRSSASNKSKILPNLKNIHRIEAKPTNLSESVSTMDEISMSTNMVTQRVDGVFRLPVPPNQTLKAHNSALEAFKAKLDSFKPRYCQRRGRTIRAKQVVVQRTLPLLPKTGANDQSILTMKVIPQGSLASDFVPIAPKFQSVQSQQSTLNSESSFVRNLKPIQHSVALSPIPIDTSTEEEISETDGISQFQNDQPSASTSSQHTDESIINTNNDIALLIPPSPTPTISTLLDIVDEIATPETKSGESCSISNNITLENSNSSTFTDFLSENARGLETPLSASPSRLLKEDDAHWLNSEVADFSLSSFLGHLESPAKSTTNTNSNINNDDSRMSQDMEAQLQSLMSENSIDYMAKFADLAAQMASDNQKK